MKQLDEQEVIAAIRRGANTRRTLWAVFEIDPEDHARRNRLQTVMRKLVAAGKISANKAGHTARWAVTT